jgi:F-type H+-transporting ATPase subunit gamma
VSDSTQSLRRTIDSGVQLQAVVRTMKALAASNIGQYEKSVNALADYYRTVRLGLGACLRNRDPAAASAGPKASAPTRELRAIVFGSDQGLVGQFNEVVAEFTIKTLADLPGKPRIWSVGERVHAHLTDAGLTLAGVLAVPNSTRAIGSLVAKLQIETETHGATDENTQLWIFYNRPLSATLFEPVSQRLLPLDAQWQRDLVKVPWSNSNLPQIIGASAMMLRMLVREYLFISLFRACAESLMSENASRLASMQRADKNIRELLERLNGSFNRVRQSGIDEELFDVISGFEALAGSPRLPMQRPRRPARAARAAPPP